ncbi:LamG domain protein jellyroll fold domain protein [Verrucomicrobia bacterium]|nr:LamG domain protein jellyroll fold domain protein [Verrucomicrobiota bacterium]
MRHPIHSPIKIAALVAALCAGAAYWASAQTLTHRYSFNDPAGSTNFADSVGGATGSLNNATAGNPNSASLDGMELLLDGTGGYATLAAGVISNYSQLTVEFWADFSVNPNWTRVFAFGDQNAGGNKNSGVDYCHLAPGNYQNLDMLDTNGNDAYANSTPGLDNSTNNHVTVVVDPVNHTMYYYNGVSVVSTEHNTVPSLTAINDTLNLIGRSLYDLDPTLNGTIHEFRVYQGVLPAASVALNDAAGPGTYLTNPGSILALHFSSPANPIFVKQSLQQIVTGDFASVSNVNLVLYGGVTYSSGNTNVLTISTNGVVKGVSVGTTTVIATYGSLSVTNSLTVLSLPTILAHRYSFTTDASDSIGGANGTFMGDAAVSGGQLVLDGGGYLSLPGDAINIPTNPAVTFEAWATIGDTPEWSHLFEFGNIAANNIYCAPRADAGGFHEFGLSEGFGGGQTLSWAHGWSNITLHITGVVDPTTSTLAVYTNGVLQVASYTASAPLTMIGTNNAALGQSSYGDPDAILSIDEFRIYSGALAPAQIAMSDLSGPNSTNFDPGALSSITVVPASYPAFSQLLAPVILANYAHLTNFNLLPNVYASANGLTITSSDPTILSVNAQNMLATHFPGTVTLSATYLGKSSSATVQVQNQAVLTHRYSFTSDASDSVGGANGTLVGTAVVSGGQVQLDGGSGDYVSLPGGLLSTYESATMDVWATISSSQQHWSRLWEFADVGPANANELYFAPAWNGAANATFFSFNAPFGGANLGPQAPPTVNQTVHLTCVLGDGSVDLYTNGVPYLSASITAPAGQAGIVGSWIGYSPYGDPGITGSVDEYRIYQGRLSPDEIVASDALGPDQILSSAPTSLTATVSSGNVTLSWPVADASFWVQASPSLTAPNWATVTNAPVLVGNTNWQVVVPATGGTRFFRLWR